MKNKPKNEKKAPQKKGCLATICVLVFFGAIISPFTSDNDKNNVTVTKVPEISQSSTNTHTNSSDDEIAEISVDIPSTDTSISMNEEQKSLNNIQLEKVNIDDLDSLQKIYYQINYHSTYEKIMDIIKSSGLPYIDAAYKNIFRTKIAFSQDIARNYPTEVGDYININYGDRTNSDMSINARTHIEYIEYYNHENDIYLVMFSSTGHWYNISDEPNGGYFVYYSKSRTYDSVFNKDEQFRKLLSQSKSANSNTPMPLTVETNNDNTNNPKGNIDNLSSEYESIVETIYIGNANSKKFHEESCSKLPAPKNQVALSSRDEAIKQGYEPCKICNP